MNMIKLLVLCAIIAVPTQRTFGDQPNSDKPNVLFIAIDDLRPELACYGRSHIKSPNIDALASRGQLFERAYCMVPTCGASRASLMTGLRPAVNRFKNFQTLAEKDAPGITTLNTHFKNSGYTTVSLGKVFHNVTDSEDGWSKPAWRPSVSDWHNPNATNAAKKLHRETYPETKKIRGPPFESFDDPDATYRDAHVAKQAITELEELATKQKPFFLAVGFYKPHLPFCAPKKYWDLYDRENIAMPENYYPPKRVPEDACHTSGELRKYATIPPEGPVSEEAARRLIHGYYACVSFVDAQVGRVLDAVERLELSDNTIVVLWGDHGWQLGEHGLWHKHTCFETSMHSPLIFHAPGANEKASGTKISSLVEFIDIYPTLCELTGLELPDHLQGKSMAGLMKDPNSPWKQYAIGRYKHGDTIRSDNFRFTEFRTRKGEFKDSMLFDHRSDPNENTNVVGESDSTVIEALSKQLNDRKGKPVKVKKSNG